MKMLRSMRYRAGELAKGLWLGHALLTLSFCAILVAVALSTKILHIVDKGEHAYVVTTLEDKDAIMQRYGIDLEEKDTLHFSGFEEGYAELVVNRAVPIEIEADGKTHNIFVNQNTVREVLNELDISLGQHDEINVALDVFPQENERITIDRIKYDTRVDVIEIPHEITVRLSTVLPEGSTRVVEAGKTGAREVKAVDKFINGELVETVIEAETLRAEPQTEIQLKGVKAEASPEPVDMDTPAAEPTEAETAKATGAPTDFLYVLENQTATAYTARAGARTATGKVAAVGYVAVNPKVIPYGTRLYIETEDGSYIYGYAVAADTGGALMSGKADVDLYFNTEEECRIFGRRKVRIYVLP